MFRFTIRDVLWLMVVVGIGVAWFSHVTALRTCVSKAGSTETNC